MADNCPPHKQPVSRGYTLYFLNFFSFPKCIVDQWPKIIFVSLVSLFGREYQGSRFLLCFPGATFVFNSISPVFLQKRMRVKQLIINLCLAKSFSESFQVLGVSHTFLAINHSFFHFVKLIHTP